MINYQEYLDVALEIAKKNAEIFKEGFFQKNVEEWKTETDPVTEFDKQIEKITREYILLRYPDHLVLGEEDGLGKNICSDFKWIVDPIDGTINYIRSIGFVSYSLALLYKNEVIVSVVCNPVLDEYFWAVKGQGAYLNGRKIQISTCDNPKHGYVGLGCYKEKYAETYHRLLDMFQSVRNPGSAALALAYVAAGRMEAVVYFKLSSWDMAGGYLLVKEAGGVITNINSSEFSLENPSVIAGNLGLYPYIKKICVDISEFS